MMAKVSSTRLSQTLVWVFTSWTIERAVSAASCASAVTIAARWFRAMSPSFSVSQNRTSTKKRILLVDDHPVVREGLAENINGQTDLMICAEADDRHEAMEAIKRANPDLVIVDRALKTSSGIALIKDIHSCWPR